MSSDQKPNFTPGPWETDRAEHDQPYLPITVRPRNHKSRRVCSIWLDDAPVEDFNAAQRANANLIAAAPDLYQALSAICDRWSFVPAEHVTEEHNIALSALAKARGETA